MFSKVEDFLKDDDFINFVLGVTPESAPRWEAFFGEHPEQRIPAEEAKSVLLAPVDVACDSSPAELRDLKDRIIYSIKGISEK